jgi:hypothetical protein
MVSFSIKTPSFLVAYFVLVLSNPFVCLTFQKSSPLGIIGWISGNYPVTIMPVSICSNSSSFMDVLCTMVCWVGVAITIDVDQRKGRRF